MCDPMCRKIDAVYTSRVYVYVRSTLVLRPSLGQGYGAWGFRAEGVRLCSSCAQGLQVWGSGPRAARGLGPGLSDVGLRAERALR